MRANSARFAAILLFALAIAGCSEGKQQAAAPPPLQVTVDHPTQRTIVDYDEYVGRFVPIESVEVRARVSGYLDSVHFTDGQIVNQGDLLFTIDKRPFQTALEQAKATLTQARANLAFADADLGRAQHLVRDRTITEQTFDQRTQAKRVAEAAVTAQEAAVRQASLDLEFTELRAPVTGRIGDRRVSPGNLVSGGTGGNTTLLATIVTYEPIRFEFTFDEASYLRYQRLPKTGSAMANPSGGVDVALKLLDEQTFDHKGRMDFVDNVIDRATGTIRGRAVFSNPTGVLTPGMFARIRVPGSSAYQALLVPEVAIGTDQTRKFVSVVGPDDVLQQKFVTLGEAVGDLRVIREGLTPEDRIVVKGLVKGRPGQKVKPVEASAAAPASPQAAAAAQSPGNKAD